MSTTNNGGPAFPVDQSVASAWAVFEHSNKPLSDKAYSELLSKLQSGMTLRDYFAAHTDVSVYTPIETFERANGRKPTIAELAMYIANIRTVEADAVLKAREA